MNVVNANLSSFRTLRCRAGGFSRRPALPLVMLLPLWIAGCSGGDDTPAASASSGMRAAPVTATTEVSESRVKRWYSAKNVTRGAPVFAENCAVCHGKGAQGAFTWRRRSADGTFPPPPLDGSGHAWHHPLSGLAAHIKNGAAPGQGTMPSFAAALNDTQIHDGIAWFQSKWSDSIYRNWLKRVGGAPG